MIRIFNSAVMVFGMILLSACGTTGDTRSFALDLDQDKEASILAHVFVDSVEIDYMESYLNVVNVHPWGKFDGDDLRNIKYSLHDTLNRNLPNDSATLESQLDIHVFIRRYIVSVSNTGGGVLATVTWAVTDSDGELVFDEQFYAWGSGYLVTTVGLIKDSVHRQIVRRIATTALILASGRTPAELPPIDVDNTSTSLDEALSQLPDSLVSMGNPVLVGIPVEPVQTIGAFIPSGSNDAPWQAPKLSDDFDWQAYLESER